MAAANEVRTGASVYTSDGHAVGQVGEVTSAELFVEERGFLHHTTRSFLLSAVQAATPDRVDLALDAAALKQDWNVMTLRDAQGRDRHVTQVGRPPVFRVPTYDEEQTTTGGPPTGEEDAGG